MAITSPVSGMRGPNCPMLADNENQCWDCEKIFKDSPTPESSDGNWRCADCKERFEEPGPDELGASI